MVDTVPKKCKYSVVKHHADNACTKNVTLRFCFYTLASTVNLIDTVRRG